MDTYQMPSQPQWLNKLREARDEALMTRMQVSMRCFILAETDPSRYVGVSVAAIRDLEVGRTKPRRRTAVTLAAALDLAVDALFPLGLDTPIRNPEGRTRITPGRRKGGRPPKSTYSAQYRHQAH
jgi:DNA-binding XRE family transcriptional regulator